MPIGFSGCRAGSSRFFGTHLFSMKPSNIGRFSGSLTAGKTFRSMSYQNNVSMPVNVPGRLINLSVLSDNSACLDSNEDLEMVKNELELDSLSQYITGCVLSNISCITGVGTMISSKTTLSTILTLNEKKQLRVRSQQRLSSEKFAQNF